METEVSTVAAGVDTHKDEHVLCVIDALGRKVREGAFPATPGGYRELAGAIGDPAGCLVVGVEGTCSFGAGLAARLAESGFNVVEVLRPKRDKRRRSSGKDDFIDAERAAELESAVAGIVREKAPAMLEVDGRGALSAAELGIAAGDNPGRMRSEASFAMQCGASPIEASSGKTSRHGLSRGGNRRANRALHGIVISRMCGDPRTSDYIAKRASEGKSKREAMRCLKRYVARGSTGPWCRRPRRGTPPEPTWPPGGGGPGSVSATSRQGWESGRRSSAA